VRASGMQYPLKSLSILSVLGHRLQARSCSQKVDDVYRRVGLSCDGFEGDLIALLTAIGRGGSGLQLQISHQRKKRVKKTVLYN
jgi:hypothetical protein